VTIFVEQWLSTQDHRPALVGLGSSAICLLIFGPDLFLIPAMLLITGILAAMRKKEDMHG
jgi:4-azaleucine resistance transporter AzlC